MSTITLLTELRYRDLDMHHWYHQQIALEEGLLIDALMAEGANTERLAWDDPLVDWRSRDTLVFRSTWNYFEYIDQFRPWLASVAARSRLVNDATLIGWNLDKHYLRDLHAAGVPIVPTEFATPDAPRSLAGMLETTGWDEVVIKPAVGGAARLTWRANRHALEDHERELAACLTREAMLVQPFQQAIERSGETSVVVIDGQVSHAVLKRPRSGDFRVQDDHGGTVHPHEPDAAECALALRAVAACPAPPAYARVDMVASAEGPRVMEVELIEPELFLRHHPSAAALLARAILNGRG